MCALIELDLVIIPRGGGTGYTGGAVPLDAMSAVINTEKLDKHRGVEFVELAGLNGKHPIIHTGHFPSRPVMPGVLMVEALAQASALLGFMVEGISLDADTLFYFVGVDGVRFKRPVEPGDQLILHTAFDRVRGGIYKFNCRATVGDELVVEASIMCTMRRVR